MKNFIELYNNLKINVQSNKYCKLTILADTSSQFLTQSIKMVGFERDFNCLRSA
jgi:hypothetical protein